MTAPRCPLHGSALVDTAPDTGRFPGDEVLPDMRCPVCLAADLRRERAGVPTLRYFVLLFALQGIAGAALGFLAGLWMCR